MLLIIMGIFALFLVLNVPIVFCMGISAVVATFFGGPLSLTIIPQRVIQGIDSFILLAIPLFILAGSLMDQGGITRRLVELAQSMVGAVRGSLGMVVVVSEMFFSGISGSTVADASAMSSMLMPGMREAGYKRAYSASIIASASAMGILIPPCNLMVVLGDIASVSVAALFLAGFIPALVLALSLFVILYFQARRYQLPAGEPFLFSRLARAIRHALVPLGMPVIIFGGILGGVCTPTEAASLAVVYAFIVGVFIYKEIKWSSFWKIAVDTGVMTGMVMLLVGMASIFSFQMAVDKVPDAVANFILSTTKSPILFLLLSNVIFIFFGAILEGIPAALILVPIFTPLVQNLGIDMLHFCILVVACIGVGVFLPPIGVGLITVCGVGDVQIRETTFYIVPFLVMLFLGIVILTLFPWLTLVVPKIFNL
jgi:tripartite ATP-independent transporter DctM subunit